MEQFYCNTAIALDFLASRGYGTTATNIRKRVYASLGRFFGENGLQFSEGTCNLWRSTPEAALLIAIKRCPIAIEQLQDVYETGTIRDCHVVPGKAPYQQLPDRLRNEIDEFVNFMLQNYPESHADFLRSSAARLMLSLSKRGISSILQADYPDIKSFYNRNDQASTAHKDSCDYTARRLFSYFSKNCPQLFGLSLALNKQYAD